ncbi:unnamed protein product [Rhizoctonia solani]|uniref:Uncharacterized protein n=1 Tax=Rhizoctonia solani TaxID=456999 RepID=A0A8H3H972_9AGAM|nr:unnamed protein product [Rhizoctonia solani]CAE7142236.1 unnamed protein product [Rhizoctonia solani]
MSHHSNNSSALEAHTSKRRRIGDSGAFSVSDSVVTAPNVPNVKNSRNKTRSTRGNGAQSDETLLDALFRSETADTAPPSESFDIEVFNDLLARWIVNGNRPITAIESEEFRELMIWLRPSLDGQLAHAADIKDRVEALKQAQK